MRTTRLAVTTTLLLAAGLLSPQSASAAVNTYVIQGHPITAAPGMALIGDSCTTSGATPPTVNELVRDGGTVGTSALGWSVAQANFEAGPVATLAGNPDNLNAYHLDVLAPSGTTGHAYARINWDADTWYVGWSSVDVPATGWRQLDLVNRAYFWTLHDAGTTTTYETAYTVQQLVTGPGFQAISLGVLLGCGGEQFFVDRMVVGNAENSSTYDFERKPDPPPPPPPPPEHHVAHMEWSTNGKDVEDGAGVAIRYGQSLWMLGHSHVHSEAGNIWYSGVGTLYQQPAKGRRTVAATGAFSPTQYAGLRVAPKTNTIYQFAAAAHDNHPATQSDPVTVWVQSRVKAKVVDKHLVQGQKLAVKGRILPAAKRVKVTLQRKRGGRWANIASSKTRKGGRFAVVTPARTHGSWKVRVRVATTLANIGTTTRGAKVTVRKFVPPRKNQPPPPPPVDTTPEVSTQVSTQQPTQVSTSAPKPPPRPPDTGRTAARTTAVAGGSSARGEAGEKP